MQDSFEGDLLQAITALIDAVLVNKDKTTEK